MSDLDIDRLLETLHIFLCPDHPIARYRFRSMALFLFQALSATIFCQKTSNGIHNDHDNRQYGTRVHAV